jgi:ribosomal protein S18 acetylase RimI-like enzyme
MSNFFYRKATIDDIPFVVDTIIEAEKSGTDILTYSTIFGLSEKDTRNYLADMLAEEIDGCELSISSFLLAEADRKIVAAVAAWVEGIEGMPSTVLKGNLLNYSLPKDAIEKALTLNSIVRDIHIEYIQNSIQIGLVYVSEAYRGMNLVSLLIDNQINKLKQIISEPNGIYVQVFGNNLAAIKAYEKAGFKKVSVKESSNKDILNYMPSNIKVLMKRESQTI